jgi:hypothetical protein
VSLEYRNIETIFTGPKWIDNVVHHADKAVITCMEPFVTSAAE